MYRFDVIHVYILAFGTYALMNLISRQKQHKYVMAFLTLYLSGQHIYRMMNEQGYRLDITTQTMILVTKLWGVSWAYKDGEMPDFKLTKE